MQMKILQKKTRGIGMWLAFAAAVLLVPTAALAQESFVVYSAKFVCGQTGGSPAIVPGKYATSVNIHNPQFQTINFHKKAVIAKPERAAVKGEISNVVPESLDSDQAMAMDCKDIRSLYTPSVTGFIEGFLVIYVPFNDSSGGGGASGDADGDGVNDDVDQCPDTPVGVSVDANGCGDNEVPEEHPNSEFFNGLFDVIAVYTAQQRKGTSSDKKIYDVQSFEVEEVSYKIIEGDPPF